MEAAACKNLPSVGTPFEVILRRSGGVFVQIYNFTAMWRPRLRGRALSTTLYSNSITSDCSKVVLITKMATLQL